MTRIIYLTAASVGFAVAGLLIAPATAKAEAFGYVNVKAGYSYLIASKGEFKLLNSSTTTTGATSTSSASAFPVGGSVGFGYSFTPDFGLRVEAEYLYRLKAKFKENTLVKISNYQLNSQIQTQIQSFLGNLYLDYYIIPSLNLYVSGGVGASLIDASVMAKDESANMSVLPTTKKATFAWQVGLGLGYAFTGNLGLDVSVRYARFGNIGVKPSSNPISADIPLSSVETLIGLTYRF